jgi:hypothetical protein
MTDTEEDDGLLNVRKYPKIMYMDIYGNGNVCWDKDLNENLIDVIFKVKYIRADLVEKLVQDARMSGYEKAKKEFNNDTI